MWTSFADSNLLDFSNPAQLTFHINRTLGVLRYTIYVHFSAHEKISLNGLTRFFIYAFKCCMHYKHMWHDVYADTNLCDRHSTRINKTCAENVALRYTVYMYWMLLWFIQRIYRARNFQRPFWWWHVRVCWKSNHASSQPVSKVNCKLSLCTIIYEVVIRSSLSTCAVLISRYWGSWLGK